MTRAALFTGAICAVFVYFGALPAAASTFLVLWASK